MIEFALVLPFLATLAFGTVDLFRAYQQQIKLRNAAREGALFGQFYPNNSTTACPADNPSTGTIVSKVQNADSTYTISSANISGPEERCNGGQLRHHLQPRGPPDGQGDQQLHPSHSSHRQRDRS